MPEDHRITHTADLDPPFLAPSSLLAFREVGPPVPNETRTAAPQWLEDKFDPFPILPQL